MNGTRLMVRVGVIGSTLMHMDQPISMTENRKAVKIFEK